MTKAFAPAARIGLINFGGGTAVQGAPTLSVELDDQAAADGGDEVQVPLRGDGEAGEQMLFKVLDRVFDGAVVAGVMRGAVERNDQVLGEHVVDLGTVEIGAVVTFEEQRRTVLVEELLEMIGNVFAFELKGKERLEAVARGEVLRSQKAEFVAA